MVLLAFRLLGRSLGIAIEDFAEFIAFFILLQFIELLELCAVISQYHIKQFHPVIQPDLDDLSHYLHR